MPRCVKNRDWEIVFLISLTNFRSISVFLNFFSYKAVFIVNVIKCTKINLSVKVFTSITVTIANGKDMDRLCLNAQCSLITATTWPTPYFCYFFDDIIFCYCWQKGRYFYITHLATPIWMQHGDLKIFIMTHQHTEARNHFPEKKRGTLT